MRWYGWEGGRFKSEGIYVYVQLSYFIIQQKLIQPCKATILQFKKEELVGYTIKQMHNAALQNGAGGEWRRGFGELFSRTKRHTLGVTIQRVVFHFGVMEG